MSTALIGYNHTIFKTNKISMHNKLSIATFGSVIADKIKIYIYRDRSKESNSE